MAFIYKITNSINGLAYIGYTSKTVDARWKQHLRNATKNSCNRKFYNAIRKYGSNCWIVETLLEVDTATNAKIKEIEYIQLYETYINGYNSTKGGDGNNGILMSEQSNQKRSNALKGKPKNYDRMHNKSHKEETKLKISEAHLGKKKPWVKWNKEQIKKRAFTRRSLTEDQYKTIHLLRDKGFSIKEIATQTGVDYHIVKKWLKKEWEIA